MADVAHSTLSGSDLHECKGASSASINTVRVADGSGSGTWQKITIDQIDTTNTSINKGVVTGFISDTAAALASTNSVYIVLPYACTVTKVHVVSMAAVNGDTVLTVANNAGTSMGTITIASAGAAAGDVDTLTPASNNTFTAGQKISISSDAGGTTVNPVTVSVEFTYT